ncbi:hypothetical protein BST95_18040 [Halioglobus japonicus]|uniref:AprE-like beta-barrel domain-containing protein n=1 Tax=Halioglobus japonicus TaxID=930805 RepID=A0AAP8SNW1_9GAMM|nr:HlyD family efflux transporter periplasmic adaptor subunit [Halioglobus japonicus]AQA19865.1 hypothetical protein BST95_18040 [Halioglobus japonicus]PLW87060.1 hypothetical protein C0029_00185 [Halioglobus japonicus]GHD10419.1 hemolysin secretion protein D [Halioglobus japonicus]
MQLFRQQALDAQRQRLYGEVLLMPRVPHLVCTALLLGWFLLTITLLMNGRYASREIVQGWLQPVQGSIDITAPADATIAEIHVRDEQHVAPGQPLLSLRRARTMTSGVVMEESLLDQFWEQHASLINRRELTQSRFTHLAQRARNSLSQSEQELDYLAEQILAASAEVDILQSRGRDARALAQAGHLPLHSADNADLRHLTGVRELAALRQRERALASRIVIQQSELELLPNDIEESIAALDFQISQVLQSISQLEADGHFTVTAPRKGTVSNLQARRGAQVAGITGPLMRITASEHLEAKLLVPVRAAGFLRKGQSVALQYHAFPHQKFGSFEGEITQFSGQALIPSHIDNNPLVLAEPVYQLTVSLRNQEVEAQGDRLPLLPGMTLDAIIILGERSLLEWLLAPIYALKGRLL